MRPQVFLATLVVLVAANSSVADLWTTPAPLTEVNSSSAEEWSPFLSYDGLTLYFARVRSPESYYGRIFQAKRDSPSGPFTVVEKVLGPLNTQAGHVLCEWVSPDNLRMYYHNETGGIFSLWVSERTSVLAPWPIGRPISELNALGKRLQMPRLTPDELTVCFDASDIAGGEGGYDLWMASRTSRDSPFSNITNLKSLNTIAGETSGCFTPDGLGLYFSSDRNGSAQLFRAMRATLDSPFGSPVHLSFFDIDGGLSGHPCLASDGSALYFLGQIGPDRANRDIWVSYSVVPLPAAVLLGMLGLGTAGWRLRRRI